MEMIFTIIVSMIFPAVIVISLTFSSAIFITTLVQDRQMGLRTILRFTGATSHAYILGLLVADMVIFMIPCSMTLIFCKFLNVIGLEDQLFSIFLYLILFSVPYLGLIYVSSYLFTKHETAFKFHLLPSLIF